MTGDAAVIDRLLGGHAAALGVELCLGRTGERSIVCEVCVRLFQRVFERPPLDPIRTPDLQPTFAPQRTPAGVGISSGISKIVAPAPVH